MDGGLDAGTLLLIANMAMLWLVPLFGDPR
jgi:hypothetical protein